jgi:hypothetical protein
MCYNKNMGLTNTLKDIFKMGADTLKGHVRRIFMAQVVKALGKGGQRTAETELNWNRGTIRKGMHELENGLPHQDNFAARGRKKAEEHLPNLLADLKTIVDHQCQTDPSFQTTRLYRRLSVAEIRRQLIAQKGYTETELPSDETLRLKLNSLGYYPRKVKRCQPVKKIPETSAIFEQIAQVNQAADVDDTVLRLSLDAKATVLLGNLSRGGYNRVEVKACDHEFRPEETVTPFGIFLPRYNELYLFLTSSKITSDFIADCLRDVWVSVRSRFPLVETLVLNQDNGPECHSHRTQFMKRMTELVDEFDLTVQLAYYPPYHSKYNPIERVWGVLEGYWQGELLDTVDTVFKFAQNMTYKGVSPIVQIVEKTYQTGVKLTQKVMAELEKRFERVSGLEKWFIRISPVPT